jgi:hypothetical protein
MRTLLLATLLALWPAYALAQQGGPGYLDPQRVVTQSLAAACAGGVCPPASASTFQLASGNADCAALISGTFSGTLVFELSEDGSNWSSAYLTPTTGSAVNSATAAFYGTAPVLATVFFRVRMSAYTSGTAVVSTYCVPSVRPYGAPG